MDTPRRCERTKADGKPCGGTPRPGRPYCVFHDDDPELAGRRAAGRRKGGVRRSTGQGPRLAVLPGDTPDAPLRTLDDVKSFLGETANHVRKGLLAPQVGNCLGVLCGQILRAVEGSELEERLATLEARIDAGGPR